MVYTQKNTESYLLEFQFYKYVLTSSLIDLNLNDDIPLIQQTSLKPKSFWYTLSIETVAYTYTTRFNSLYKSPEDEDVFQHKTNTS